MEIEPLLEHRVVSPEEMKAWPVDRAASGQKLWAETAWGAGHINEGETTESTARKLLFNWNTWPCRIVFQVGDANAGNSIIPAVVRGSAAWRRSKLSIRMKGLKLVPAQTGEKIADARVVQYDQERVTVEFRPTAGAGLYYLYYGAYEEALFSPSPQWLSQAEATRQPTAAKALRVEARCKIDDFDAMEQIASAVEMEQLQHRFADVPYLVFPEDRDRPIKFQFELPASWAREGPKAELPLQADRNEYRVFQLGIWACRAAATSVQCVSSDLKSTSGQAFIPGHNIQCLTLVSRIKSKYIARPRARYDVPKGQVRALWFGIDIPQDTAAGEYRGNVTVQAEGLPPTVVPLRVVVSDTVVPERGDHDLWRLSRLRWIESDIGLSDEVLPPYSPLKTAAGGREISDWAHTFNLAASGLVEAVRVGDKDVLAGPMKLTGKCGGKELVWQGGTFKLVETTAGHVTWTGQSSGEGLTLNVQGTIEYDGSAVIDLSLAGPSSRKVEDLALSLTWAKEHALLASGLGYRGRRDGDRCWRQVQRSARGFSPALWMGSIDAGMLWETWLPTDYRGRPIPGADGGDGGEGAVTNPWEDVARADAATVTEERDGVQLRLNLGSHEVGADKRWRMRFALLPTPVKPPDARHWDFRYMHKGGGFTPGDRDTPQGFLEGNCKLLDEVKAYGVKRLNLHDWWGPMFNYARQWEGSDNLTGLTTEAHKRNMFVKVYNSGRELSNFAPEFWAIVNEGACSPYRDGVDPNVRLYFQDAWRPNHLGDHLPPSGWVRVHAGLGTEHSVPVSNATRNGNFYLESMRYMTQFYGTDGAYWDGADGPTLGHREMAKRLWTIFRQINPGAVIDVHQADPVVDSPIASRMLCFPFIDSVWRGEGFDYAKADRWTWLVEIAGLPFGVPSEMLGGDDYVGRGMLFGIWPRHGWCEETDVPGKLWAFFDTFGIAQADMLGWWLDCNGVTVDRPATLVTAYRHPKNGVLLVVATWHPQIAKWMEMTFDVSLLLDRQVLNLPPGMLAATDIITGEPIDIDKPVPLKDMKFGRLIHVRGQ